jgi:hypothetical protein
MPPDFIVIGAAKSGTTSLYSYCSQHPEIFMATMKEARYLAHLGENPRYRGYGEQGPQKMARYGETIPKTLDEYLELFRGASPNQKTGEASPAYLYLPAAPEKIRETVPEVKLIAVLRNPVDRAFSSFLHLKRDNAESLSFSRALAAERQRIAENAGLLWRYVDLGLYAQQLKRFLKVFPEEQMKVILYEDLCRDPGAEMSSIFRFIGVDPSFEPDTDDRLNVSGIPRNRAIYDYYSSANLVHLVGRMIPKFARRIMKSGLARTLLKKPELEPSIRKKLVDCFREDVGDLEELIGRDLSGWLALKGA